MYGMFPELRNWKDLRRTKILIAYFLKSKFGESQG